MFVYNLKLNGNKLGKLLLILLFVIITIVTIIIGYRHYWK